MCGSRKRTYGPTTSTSPSFTALHFNSTTKLPDVEKLLKDLDPSFAPVFDPSRPTLPTGYRNNHGFNVEFLTPNRSDANFEKTLVKLPALGDVGAQPLRYLDFLIRQPIRSVLLHDAGIGVVVPAPARYAVHKLIVATRRSASIAAAKSTKDIDQAAELIEAMSSVRQNVDLGFAWMEAWERGPSWRRRLALGALRLPDEPFKTLSAGVVDAARLDWNDPDKFGISSGRDGLIKRIAARKPDQPTHHRVAPASMA